MKEKLVPAAVGFLVGAVFVGALAHFGICPFQTSDEKPKEGEPAAKGSV